MKGEARVQQSLTDARGNESDIRFSLQTKTEDPEMRNTMEKRIYRK